MSTVLVVDDKEMMRDSVGATLRRAGYDIVVASDAQDVHVAHSRTEYHTGAHKRDGASELHLVTGARAGT